MIDYKPARFRRLIAMIADFYIMLMPCFVMLFAAALLPAGVQTYVLFISLFLCLHRHFQCRIKPGFDTVVSLFEGTDHQP